MIGGEFKEEEVRHPRFSHRSKQMKELIQVWIAPGKIDALMVRFEYRRVSNRYDGDLPYP
jgi:hypothetical protein